MKKALILSMAFTMAGTIGAFAQTANSASNANSGSASNATASSGSASVFNNYSDGTSVLRYEGAYDVTNVPSVAAPGIITAHNCALGASGGASGSGFGISFGGSYVDEDCQRISEAAALNQLVGANVAVRHLAQSPDICKTLRSSGIIPGNSLCTDGEKRAASRSGGSANASPVAVAAAVPTSPRPNARPVGYSKCQMNDLGQVVIRYTNGADKSSAKAQCLASLGY